MKAPHCPQEAHRPPAAEEKAAGQVWMWYNLESPLHSSLDPAMARVMDWTATYRRDSTIVAPYAKVTHPMPPHATLFQWKDSGDLGVGEEQRENYASNKTKMVAWFVSNCHARNNRLEFARALGQHVQVDVYGGCGSLKCPRSDAECVQMLRRDYRFYLAFENSNCKDYITEKFFTNALGHRIVPIVMGPSIEDYTAVAPPNSFIHVDHFATVVEMAEYLELVAADETMYNSYFEWEDGGSWIRTGFFCRVCSMLHYQQVLPLHHHLCRHTALLPQWRGGCRSGGKETPSAREKHRSLDCLPVTNSCVNC